MGQRLCEGRGDVHRFEGGCKKFDRFSEPLNPQTVKLFPKATRRIASKSTGERVGNGLPIGNEFFLADEQCLNPHGYCEIEINLVIGPCPFVAEVFADNLP